MGRSVGTVKSWRFRGRERLRDRLIRLGLAPSAGLGAALSVDVARAAVAHEARFKTTYNNSIVGLEEAKGTLLEHDQVALAEAPKPIVSMHARAAGPSPHDHPGLLATPAPALTTPAASTNWFVRLN